MSSTIDQTVYWHNLLTEHLDSGLSAEQFCEERGLSISIYKTKAKKYKEQIAASREIAAAFTPIRLTSSAKAASSRIAIEIMFPNGTHCKFPPDFNCHNLITILKKVPSL